MKDYLEFVQHIEIGITAARNIPLPVPRVSDPASRIPDSSPVLLFSPHPDDECITGLLPLRLMREAEKQIINVPITFGSNKERQAGRQAELAAACGYLGWTSLRATEGLSSLEVEDVVAILASMQPDIIFMPHVEDWNPRHISTNVMVMDALKQLGNTFSCLVVETEFWGAMDEPNLMVEADGKTVAELVAATSLHVGEIERNPYHLLLPAWMQDNVRRGGELVGGAGTPAPAFSFATLYRLRRWESGQFVDILSEGRFIPMGSDHLKEVF